MDGQQLDQNSNPTPSVPTVPLSLEQSPGLTVASTPSTSSIQQLDSNNEERQRIARTIKKLGIASLIIGIIVLIGLLLPLILFAGHSNDPTVGALVYLLYAPYYMYVRFGGTIACIVLLIIILVDMKKYKIKFSKYVVMAIVGLLLTFSPYVYSGVQTAVITSDPFKITAGSMSTYDCKSSAERAERSDLWSDADSLRGTDPDSIAEEIACSYLEYFYDNGEEPSSNAQLLQYYQSYNAKNGIATATFNADQPEKADIYNIITHRSCDYDDTNNDSAISVWFRVEEKNNGIGCIDITADEDVNGKTKSIDLYDLKQSKEWLAFQFMEWITKDEAREIIENKRNEQGDDTWTTGSVEVDGKSRDGYYWVRYEEIRNDGTTNEYNAFFHKKDGVWTFEVQESDYDFDKHHFVTL